MKLSLLVSLLVLFTILYEAQGIRLGKFSMSTGNIHYQIQKEASLMERSSTTANSGGTGESTVAACKDDENCSGGILNRKLMSKPPTSTSTSTPTTITTTTTSSKNHPNDANKEGHATPKAKPSSKGHNKAGKEAKLSVSPSPFTKYREVNQSEQYPDIIDIAGMDYSPARRKPPIHN